MKVVAALAVLLAVTAVAGASPAPAPVLGFTWSGSQLAWFDPATLRQVSRKAAPVARHTCAWEFGAGGARLAASLCGGTDSLDIRFVDTRALRPLGDVPLGTTGWVNGLAWLRADRVVAVVDRDEGGAIVFVIDPQSRRVVRRVALDRDAWWFTRLPNAVALLLVPTGRIGAVQAAVVDAAGEIRRTTLGRVTGGLIVDESGDEPAMTQRGPAFAVDTGTGTAYAVDPSLVVAEVDLATLAVAYHTAGAARALQKSIDGPQRSARWLGDGTLAITGVDYARGVDAKGQQVTRTRPFGLRLVNTRDWSVRTVDRRTTWITSAGNVLVAQGDDHTAIAYGQDGTERWRVTVPDYSWLDARGEYAYLCDNGYLRRVLRVATGETAATFPRRSNRRCAAVLVQ